MDAKSEMNLPDEVFEAIAAQPAIRPDQARELETYLIDDEETVDQPVVDIKEGDQTLGYYNRRERRMIAKHLGINRAIKYAQERVKTYEKSDVRKKKRKTLRKRLQSSSSSSSRSSSSSAPRNTLTTSEEPQMMQATASPSSV